MKRVNHCARPENEGLVDLSEADCGTSQMHGVAGSGTSCIINEECLIYGSVCTHTSVEDERGALQIESERDPVCTDSNTFSDAVVVVDFVTVILQFSG